MRKSAIQSGAIVDVLPSPCRFYNPKAMSAIWQLARTWSPHIIHGAVLEGNALGSWAAWRAGVPCIMEEATTTIGDRSLLASSMVRLLTRRAHCVIAVSETVRKSLIERGVSPNKIRVVPNGVSDPGIPDETLTLRARDDLGIPRDAYVVGSVTRLHEDVKRLSDILAAATSLPEHLRSRTYVVLVGDGPDRELLQQLAADLGIADRVRLTGARTDHETFYGLLDVFILSSRVEASPLALREAMLAQRPCIATRVGDAPELIQDGTTGRLVDPGHPRQISAVLQEWLPQKELRSSIGKAARRAGISRFLLEDYLTHISNLYVSAATSHAASAN